MLELNRSRRQLAPAALVAACVALIAGCGSDQPFEIAPVSGVVTLDGKPVPYTQIVFTPEGGADAMNPGPGSTAFCNEDGTFELKTVRGDVGAVVGSHVVRITAHGPVKPAVGDRDMGPPPKEEFPAKFNAETTLTFEVPADGTTEAKFELTTN